MSKTPCLFAFFLLNSLVTQAGIKDSIRFYLKHKEPEWIGGISTRNTFISSTKTVVNGISGGKDYGNKIRLLAGIYWLPAARPVTERKRINVFTPSEQLVDEVSKFWYVGLTGDYVFFKSNKWTLDVPMRIGFGTASISHFDTTQRATLLDKKRSAIVPVESGIGALYKIAWWIGVSGGLGSRIVIGKKTSQKFSGTYYNLGITVFLGDIYNYIRKDMKQNPIPKRK